MHVAGFRAPHVAHVPESEFRETNVSVTDALLTESSEKATCRFVYTSSTSVYGHSLVATDRSVWVNEDLNPRPRDIYDETKLAAEALVEASPHPSVVLRVARCFPEPLPLLARYRLHRGVGRSDVAAAHVLALARSDVTGVFNIAGPLLFDKGDASGSIGRRQLSYDTKLPRWPLRLTDWAYLYLIKSTGFTTPEPLCAASVTSRDRAYSASWPPRRRCIRRGLASHRPGGLGQFGSASLPSWTSARVMEP